MADENDNIPRDDGNDNSDAQVDETEETTETTTESSDASGDDSASNSVADNEARFTRLEATLERVLGEISAIREAQGIMVENGAVITDTDADLDFTADDAFVPPAELDLLI